MEPASFILALDPGKKTGWARMELGCPPPQSGSVVLRKDSEDRSIEAFNLGAFIGDICRDRRPDLLAYEEPWSVEAWFAHCKKLGRMQNGVSVENAHRLAAVIDRECGRLGIPAIQVRRQSVLKHFTGRANHGGRELAKAAVLHQAKTLEFIPRDCKDDNRADAVSILDYAAAVYGRKHAPPPLNLFDQGRLRHA